MWKPTEKIDNLTFQGNRGASQSAADGFQMLNIIAVIAETGLL